MQVSHEGLVEAGAALVHSVQVPLSGMQALRLDSCPHVLCAAAAAALGHRPVGSLHCVGSCISLHRACSAAEQQSAIACVQLFLTSCHGISIGLAFPRTGKTLKTGKRQ